MPFGLVDEPSANRKLARNGLMGSLGGLVMGSRLVGKDLRVLSHNVIVTLIQILLPRPRLSLASGQVGMLEILGKTNASAF